MNFSPSLIVLVLASLACIGQVNSACFDLFKQYFECYLLKMTLVDDGWRQYYAPDPSIEDNNVPDRMYAMYLDEYARDDSIDLMRWTHQEFFDCDSEFCQCVRQRKTTYWNPEDTYRIYFESDEIYSDVKNILVSLDNALADNRKSLEELQNTWGFGLDEDNLPSLTNFCAKAEFSGLRSLEYNNYDACFDNNNSIWWACEYYRKVDSENREVVIDGSVESRERDLICLTLRSKNCLYEQQMFNAMVSWVESYNRLDLGDNESLSAYLEGLIAATSNIDLEKNFDQMYISVYTDAVYYKSLDAGWGVASFNVSGTSMPLLVSDSLSIVADFETNNAGSTIVFKLTITVSDQAPIELELNSSDLQNTTITNNDGINILQIVAIKYDFYSFITIYDFSSETITTYFENYVATLAPTRVFEQSNGFFVQGPPQNNNDDGQSSGSEAEIKIECKQKCKSINKALKAVASPNHIATQNDLKRCKESC